jgi:hypothetical protein
MAHFLTRPRSTFFSPVRPARGVFFFEIQANRRIRFARSSILEQHERPKQAEPYEACSEPGLPTKDSEDTQAQRASRHQRNQNIPAH